ncbi:MAG: hypothetical protein V7K38_15760 [Nostoc sp.]|uniref:hypothetical protein n=1 Tax=Nostoc sp. TaxID=1180 RepID=UPI002FF51DB4
MISAEEKKKIFHIELVKYGVEYEQARKAAQILACSQADELLSQQDRQDDNLPYITGTQTITELQM